MSDKRVKSTVAILVVVFVLLSVALGAMYSTSIDETMALTLKKGSKGDSVNELQQALNDHGYSVGTVDGNFGKGTEDQLKAFQKANGIDADGVAGNKTLKLLGIGETSGEYSNQSYTDSDLYLLAKTE